VKENSLKEGGDLGWRKWHTGYFAPSEPGSEKHAANMIYIMARPRNLVYNAFEKP
jgi:hypothetical protein